MSASESKRVGPWILDSPLGEGGNAVVWRATRDGSEPVALKVINATHAGKEPYRRFVAEIATLMAIGPFPGVLPVIDAYVPDAPQRENRPWLAMPIAQPLAVALDGRPLEDVVAAVATVASTLAALLEQHQLSHRDIKPGNLYELDGDSLVGDFGLVDVPDLEELTRSNRPVGPAHFTAYEMIADPVSADGAPADVYSLGKTLWVLATGQRFPPEGHQPVGVRGFGVGNFRPHARADVLDRIVEGCTRIHPEDRPSMARVTADLSAWRELSAKQPVIDVSQIRNRFVVKRAPELAQRERVDRWREAAFAAARNFQEAVRPLNEAIQSIDSDAELEGLGEDGTRNLLRTRQYMGSVEILWSLHRASILKTSEGPLRYALRMARTIELADSGDLIFHAGIDVGTPTLGGNDFFWMSGEHSAPAESVDVDRIVQDLAQEMARQLSAALEVFVEKVPGTGEA